ncbi:hypothetical protein MFIFM68171_08978 [Madurella fahalii]|uniref:Uncharacterized protein n=1 Tax=Madurella fahalii TaxID=1157608 RepID=A0ABQ0GLX9_9PEZI
MLPEDPGSDTADDDWHTAVSESTLERNTDMAHQSIPEANVQSGYEPQATDVVIAVMGTSGSGKSTFIRQLCVDDASPPEPGHGLQSCTQKMAAYRCKPVNALKNVCLVDTPSFDNTKQRDTEVLKEIAQWLVRYFAKGVKLRGILYLRSVTEMRVRHSEVMGLEIFKQLCGPKAFPNVLMVTTKWEVADGPRAMGVEEELAATPEFWGWMRSRGAQIKRHHGSLLSASALIRELVSLEEEDLVLKIQDEMLHGGKSCSQTKAGKAVEYESAAQAGKFSQGLSDVKKAMGDDLQARIQESVAETAAMYQQQNELHQLLTTLKNQQEALTASIRTLAESQRENATIIGRVSDLSSSHQLLARILRQQKEFTAHIKTLSESEKENGTILRQLNERQPFAALQRQQEELIVSIKALSESEKESSAILRQLCDTSPSPHHGPKAAPPPLLPPRPSSAPSLGVQPLQSTGSLGKGAHNLLGIRTLKTSPCLRNRDSHSLCSAAEEGRYEDVRQMLEHEGADPAMCGPLGWTPLHWAAAKGRADVVKLLLQHNAPVNAISNTGLKPLNMAKTDNIRSLLLKNGAEY